jgi:hypothetical protein
MSRQSHLLSDHVWPSRVALVAVSLAYVVLPVIEARFILRSSANIPISDTWNFVPIISSFARTGYIPWGHIFAFYGDNRPVLERLGLLVDGKYFALDVQLVKLASVLVGVFETVCAIWAFRLALPRVRPVVVLLAAYPVALAIFCWNNWQNLLDEWNAMNLAGVALSLFAILLIVSVRPGRGNGARFLIAAIVVCALASFTGESGNLSWIACAFVLWLPNSRFRLVDKLVFSTVAVVFLALYFSGSSGVASGHPLHHLAKVIEFALICLGDGVIGGGVKELGLARAIGVGEVVVVVVLAALYMSDERLRAERSVQAAAGLIAFGAMGAVATGVSRLQIGLGTAMSSRYVVLTAPVIIGIYLVAVRLAAIHQAGEPRRSPRLTKAGLFAIPCLLATALSVIAIVSDVKESKASPNKRAYYLSLKHMTCDPSAYSDSDLSKFDRSGGLNATQKVQLLAEMRDLQMAHLSVFSGRQCEAYVRAGINPAVGESS